MRLALALLLIPFAHAFRPVLIGEPFRETSFLNGEESAKLGEICGRQPKGATTRQFPWAVSIMMQGRNRIGGTIISPYHVLTSAHGFLQSRGNPRLPCLMLRYRDIDELHNRRTVAYGGQCIRGNHSFLPNHPDCPEADVVFNKIRSVIVNGDFGDRSCGEGQDWAVIEMEFKIHFNDKTAPACLPHPKEPINQSMEVVGWGRLSAQNLSGPLLGYATMRHDVTCTAPKNDFFPTEADDYICIVSADRDNFHKERACHVGFRFSALAQNTSINPLVIDETVLQGHSGAGVEQLDAEGRATLIGVTSFGSRGCPSDELVRLTNVAKHVKDICKQTGVCYSLHKTIPSITTTPKEATTVESEGADKEVDEISGELPNEESTLTPARTLIETKVETAADLEKKKLEDEQRLRDEEALKKLKATEEKKIHEEEEQFHAAEKEKLLKEENVRKIHAEEAEKIRLETEKLKEAENRLQREEEKIRAAETKLTQAKEKLTAARTRLQEELQRLKEAEQKRLEEEKKREEEEKKRIENARIKAEEEKKKAEESRKKAEEEAKKLKADEQKKAEEAARNKEEEEKRKAEQEKLRAEETAKKAEEEQKKVAAQEETKLKELAERLADAEQKLKEQESKLREQEEKLKTAELKTKEEEKAIAEAEKKKEEEAKRLKEQEEKLKAEKNKITPKKGSEEEDFTMITDNEFAAAVAAVAAKRV